MKALVTLQALAILSRAALADGLPPSVLNALKAAQISASSVGTTYGNKLLIGSITDKQVLVCEQN